MTYSRPGAIVYVGSAAAAVVHGAPVKDAGAVGVALKQQTYPWTAGYGGAPSPQTGIAVGERYAILVKGVVQVANSGSFVQGDRLFITSANALSKVTTGNSKYGVVVEVAGMTPLRGVPTGMMRVNLDLKGQF
jgi:hypothetical protein